MSRVLVAADALLYKSSDGSVWVESIYDYHFWKRYLDVFDEVLVVARMKTLEKENTSSYILSSGKNVLFSGLPFVRGTISKIEYFKGMRKELKCAAEAVKKADCAIIRLPSIHGMLVLHELKKIKKPYAIEIVANPRTVYEDKVISKILTWHLKREVKYSHGVAYVTRSALQKEYPCRRIVKPYDDKFFASSYSSAVLTEDFFKQPKEYKEKINHIEIVHVANRIDSEAKGHIVCMEVIKMLSDAGIDAHMKFIGDGDKIEEFRAKARDFGIESKISFIGRISDRESFRNALSDADFFLFPSFSEGLPRALLEAMALGLICIASDVGGIPEILKSEYIFKPDESNLMANKIMELCALPERMAEISRENIEIAREYSEDKLQQKRNAFYRKLQEKI